MDDTIQTTNPTAVSVFIALAARFFQVNPAGVIPAAPPAAPFDGDALTLSVGASETAVSFTASAANNVGVRTELLVQPLASQNRTPQPARYRSGVVVAFASGSLTAEVTVTPGWYALAYRYINAATGQIPAVTPLGVELVG